MKILFVCLGNICRSPMAEFVFKDIVNKQGLANDFFIDSAGTSDYNEKRNLGIYPETKKILDINKIPYTEHISRHLKKTDYDKFDYILVMDKQNLYDVLEIVGEDKEKKVYRLLDFTSNPRDIIDPWYYGNFNLTYEDIVLGCNYFLDYILNSK